MTQIIYVPIGGRDWPCLCGDIHHWVDGDFAYQCECGRMYRKAADYAFFSSHLGYKSDDNVIAYVEDFEL